MLFSKKVTTKEEVNAELELYKKERQLDFEKDLFEYQKQVQEEMIDLRKRCVSDIEQIEHDYHYASELKGIELAKLDAKIQYSEELIKSRYEVVKADQHLIDQLRSEIQTLNKIINSLIDKKTTIALCPQSNS